MGASRSTWRRLFITPCLLAGWLSVAAPTSAQTSPRTVVLLVDSHAGPVSRRLVQEIESLGLTVKLVTAGSTSAATLPEEAAAARAVAAIYVAGTAASDIDMTILNGQTGKTVSFKLSAAVTPEPSAAELIPTRAVELLRASLLPLAARAEIPRGVPANGKAAEPHEAAPPQSRGRLAVMLGPALLHSVHVRPGAQLQSSITWMPLQRFGLEAAVLAPLVAARLTSPQGSVELWGTLFRLGGVVELGPRTSPVLLRCKLGIEHERLRLQGKPNAPYRGAIDSVATFAPFVSVAPRFRLAAGLHAVTELALALASPTTVIRVAGHEVTNWGRPLATVAVGLELEWPASPTVKAPRTAARALAPR
ncbi:MAG TPA: hypothetical protein VHP33_02210 [Polyangiaceae bacterium]|nr:hypothetical protein [Polyangiaceae bacterium]